MNATLRAAVRSAWAAVVLTAALAGAAERQVPLGLDAYMPVPADNPLTAEKAELGRKLFFDPLLSRDHSLPCSGCHDPELGFTDDKPVGVGVEGRKGTRRSPRLVNRGYGRTFFWDGRAASLEEQVLQPIDNPLEMDLHLDEAIGRLRSHAEYSRLFGQVFGGAPDRERLAFALASYVRTIVSGDSPYDRHVGGDRDALTAKQKRGLEVFRGQGSCGVCHLGPNLTDEEFHNTGIGWAGEAYADEGRYKVTGEPGDHGAFKTPTLREVARSGPYMHDGSLATLEDVVDFYDDGGRTNPNLDRDIAPLGLSADQKSDLVAFLKALNGRLPRL